MNAFAVPAPSTRSYGDIHPLTAPGRVTVMLMMGTAVGFSPGFRSGLVPR